MNSMLLTIILSMSCLQSTVELNLQLFGERFANPNGSIHLNCSSDTVPIGMAANLQVNEESYSTTRLIDGKCFSSVFGRKCSLDICDCSKNGLWYSHIYKTWQEEGSIITISCSMTFKQGPLSDSIQVNIVEITEWNEWTNWTLCSEPCGGGSQNRSRSCNYPLKDDILGNCVGDTLETNNCNTHTCEYLTSSFNYSSVIIGITAISIFIMTAAVSAILSRGRFCANTIYIVGPHERSPQIPIYHSAPEPETTYHIYDDTNGDYLEVIDDNSHNTYSDKSEDFHESSNHEYEDIDNS